MKCDFCNEEIPHKSYVVHRNICGIKAIDFNFCDRTCMIAEKIHTWLLNMSDGINFIHEGKDLSPLIKNRVIQISECTEEEYNEGLNKFNECCNKCCKAIDKSDI